MVELCSVWSVCVCVRKESVYSCSREQKNGFQTRRDIHHLAAAVLEALNLLHARGRGLEYLLELCRVGLLAVTLPVVSMPVSSFGTV